MVRHPSNALSHQRCGTCTRPRIQMQISHIVCVLSVGAATRRMRNVLFKWLTPLFISAPSPILSPFLFAFPFPAIAFMHFMTTAPALLNSSLLAFGFPQLFATFQLILMALNFCATHSYIHIYMYMYLGICMCTYVHAFGHTYFINVQKALNVFFLLTLEVGLSCAEFSSSTLANYDHIILSCSYNTE